MRRVDGAAFAGAWPACRPCATGSAASRAEWRIREVGDGNLNLVFIVEGPAGGLVVKQALPYVRLVGESWPLPLERSWFEYSALVEQARHAPGLTPKVFHFDRAQAMIVMEYLSPHVIMRKGLVRRRRISALRRRHRRISRCDPVPHLGARRHRGRAQGARSRLFAPTSRCARSPRTWSSPIPTAKRRSTGGPAPDSTPTERAFEPTRR